MKTDLTHLSLENQIAAVADRLRELVKCGVTAAPDLHRYFKHRAFKQPAQRAWHFKNLLAAAVLLLNGRKAEFDKVFAAMQASAVIFEAGDHVLFGGVNCRVIEVQPEGKLFIEDGFGRRRTVSAKACSPVLPTDPKPWPAIDAT